jgi:hypothetical protein
MPGRAFLVFAVGMARRILMKRLFRVFIAIFIAPLFFTSALSQPIPWDKQINGAGRFQVLSQFNGAAVLDKETGLVWEQAPSTTEQPWFNAVLGCYSNDVGGRKGWRLPTIEELTSLIDPTRSDPSLPVDHPFSGVQSNLYWSTTAEFNFTTNAWVLNLDDGQVNTAPRSGLLFRWCVRGGHGYPATGGVG